MDNAATRSHKLRSKKKKKNPSARSRIHFFVLLVKEIMEASPTIQVIAIVLGCSSQLGDKTLLSNTPHT